VAGRKLLVASGLPQCGQTPDKASLQALCQERLLFQSLNDLTINEESIFTQAAPLKEVIPLNNFTLNFGITEGRFPIILCSGIFFFPFSYYSGNDLPIACHLTEFNHLIDADLRGV